MSQMAKMFGSIPVMNGRITFGPRRPCFFCRDLFHDDFSSGFASGGWDTWTNAGAEISIDDEIETQYEGKTYEQEIHTALLKRTADWGTAIIWNPDDNSPPFDFEPPFEVVIRYQTIGPTENNLRCDTAYGEVQEGGGFILYGNNTDWLPAAEEFATVILPQDAPGGYNLMNISIDISYVADSVGAELHIDYVCIRSRLRFCEDFSLGFGHNMWSAATTDAIFGIEKTEKGFDVAFIKANEDFASGDIYLYDHPLDLPQPLEMEIRYKTVDLISEKQVYIYCIHMDEEGNTIHPYEWRYLQPAEHFTTVTIPLDSREENLKYFGVGFSPPEEDKLRPELYIDYIIIRPKPEES